MTRLWALAPSSVPLGGGEVSNAFGSGGPGPGFPPPPRLRPDQVGPSRACGVQGTGFGV